MTRYRRAAEHETDRALELIFRQSASSPTEATESAHRVRLLHEYLASEPAWLEGVWVADRNGRFLTACALIAIPGKTGTAVVPSGWQSRQNFRQRDAARVLRCMVRSVSPERVRLIQAIVPPACGWQDQVLAGAGFHELAKLVYQEKPITRTYSTPAMPAGLVWRRYDQTDEQALREVLIGSYQDTLDCPGLNGLRQIDDVVASHRATGEFDPRLWWLLEDRHNPIACLLTARLPQVAALELVYMGVIPEARGRGIGKLLIGQAAHLASESGLSKVTLTVDAGNRPARRLYRRAGFVQTDQRRVWIWSREKQAV